MSILGIEFIGFLGLAVLSIEVAVYAIVTSFISRVVRYTEEEVVEKTDRLKAVISEISSRKSDGGVHDTDITELEKRLDELKAGKTIRDEVRNKISIWRALFVPGSLALLSILVLTIGALFLPNYYDIGLYISAALLATSIYFEIPILRTIHQVAQWKDEGGFDELKKIMEEVARINMSLAEDAMRSQVETSGRLIDKIDELIGVVSETMGLKEADFGISFYDDVENEVESLNLETGEIYSYMLRVKNNSPYPVKEYFIDIILPKQFSLGTDEIDDSFTRGAYTDTYPEGPGIRFEGFGDYLPIKHFLTRLFLVRCNEPFEADLIVWIGSSSHERGEKAIPVIGK